MGVVSPNSPLGTPVIVAGRSHVFRNDVAWMVRFSANKDERTRLDIKLLQIKAIILSLHVCLPAAGNRQLIVIARTCDLAIESTPLPLSSLVTQCHSLPHHNRYCFCTHGDHH